MCDAAMPLALAAQRVIEDILMNSRIEGDINESGLGDRNNCGQVQQRALKFIYTCTKVAFGCTPAASWL